MREINIDKLSKSKYLDKLIGSRAYRVCKYFSQSIFFQLIYGISVAYSYIFYLLRKKNDLPNNDQLSIVAIAKNEGNYIREWVAYHKVLGIGHIYLYDNESTDNTIDCIRDFIDSEFVTLIDFPGQKMQLKAYNDALKRWGGINRYMAFIDCDEFLVIDKDKLIIDVFDEIAVSVANVGGIALNWKMYGSSGHIHKPAGLVIESFQYRADTANGKGTECVKTVVIPSRVVKFAHPHYPVYKLGYYGVSTSGKVVPEWNNAISHYDKIWINHYFTKSLEEWKTRRSLGKADLGTENKRTIQEFYEHDNNDIYDCCALNKIDDIKSLMK